MDQQPQQARLVVDPGTQRVDVLTYGRDNGGMGSNLESGSTVAGPGAVQNAVAEANDLLREVAAVLQRDPDLDPDTVRHTLAVTKVLPLARILVSKRAAGRPKDQLVVPVLEQVVALQAAKSDLG